jgi:acyl carrier protein
LIIKQRYAYNIVDLSIIEKGERIMFETIKGIIVDTLQVDEGEVKKSTVLRDDLGADSLDLFELAMALEDEYGLEIETEALENIVTVEDILAYIEEHK